jgi:hypothetical protein
MPNQDLTELAESFTRFAEACREASPLYEQFCLNIAADEEILSLASESVASPRVNLLLAAVQYLLLKGYVDKLSRYYPNLATAGDVTLQMRFDPYPSFKQFCLKNKSQILSLLKTRLVQTNEVNRCALLYPAFNHVAKRANGKPLAFIEIGSAAGFNLLFDSYAYDYGLKTQYGKANSPILLNCQLQGKLLPTLSTEPAAIDSRTGIDLNPLDINNADDVLWLKALIWPEQKARQERLNAVIAYAKEIYPRQMPTMLKGDALDLLPDVLNNTAHSICLFHSHTLNQFSDEARLDSLVRKTAQEKDVFVISLEWLSQSTSKLELKELAKDKEKQSRLALCDQRGQWLEWLAED